MDTWLRCTLFPGQFRSELSAVVQTASGQDYSLFVARTDCRYDDLPTRNQPVEGWIKVQVIDQKDDLYLVRLPQSTLENGQFVTVSANKLESPPRRPLACEMS